MAGLLSHTLRAHDEDCAVNRGIQVWSPGVHQREWHCQRGASGQAGVELAVGKANLPERLTCTSFSEMLKQYSSHQGPAHQPPKQCQHMFLCT